MSRASPQALAAALTLAAIGACTSFEGLEPDLGGAPPNGGGGAGGGEPEGPASLLPLFEAANLCSVVFRCPTLGGSIFLSTGIPLVQTDAEGRPTAWNYSACVDWLTAPLEAGRVGFEPLRDELFGKIIAETDCGEAASHLPFVVSGDPIETCGGSQEDLCSGKDTVLCPEGVTAQCVGGVIAPGSTCVDPGAGGVGCAVGTCSTPDLWCDSEYVFECTADGLNVGLSCETYGLSCQAPAGCVASNGQTACDEIGQQRCADAERRARACAIRQPSGGLLAAEVECDSMEMVCVEEGGTARCARPDATCSPYDVGLNLCQGDEVLLCVQGQPTTFDCSRIGLSCIPGSGSQTAHCG